METQKPLLKDEDGKEIDVHFYRLMIGSLMYLRSSRPDIMFVVCACARYQVNPKVSHLHAVKRIFRYLKGQPKLGLWYPKDSPFDLVAYTYSDYAGASLDRKSTIRGEVSKVENATTKMLCGLDQLMERKEDGDRLTKSAHFLATREDYSTEKLARLYIDKIIAWHGVHVSIILDWDGRFASRFLQTSQKALGTRLDMSTAYHPQTDGQSERIIMTLEDMLRGRKPLEFEVRDQVLLKVSPWKGVIRFGKKGKLAPRYVGPFEILGRVSHVAYRLRLPEELSSMHDTFHVSNLKKCLADANLHVPLDEINVDKTFRFVKEPVEIMDCEVKSFET
ncbi:putative reverse transcriptase domain-containing protein [Tanacetum coccineum]